MSFKFPEFWYYPPYFTLQPVEETRRKQLELWRNLILEYCKSTRTWIIRVDDESFKPFRNKEIERHLNRIARVAVLDSLVEHGVGEWIRDKKHKAECLILWKNVHDWAESIFAWAKSNQHSIVLLEDLRSGFDVEKTEIEGMPDEILLPALKELERKGKIKRFRSDNGQIGVKFFLHMI